MYPQQQYQPLPYAADQLQWPVGNYQFVPNITLEQNLLQYQQVLPALTQIMINDIQSRARMSPLRTFFFNQMARNGFNNPDFAAMVKGAVEYFAYMVRRGMIQDPNSGLMKAGTEMNQFITANNARIHPALSNSEDPGKLQYVLNQFDQITQDLQRERMMASQQYPGVMQQQQFGGGMGMGFNQFSQQPYSAGPNYSQAVGSAINRNYGGSSSSGVFTTGQPGTIDSADNGVSMGRNYGARGDSSAAAASEELVQEAIIDSLEQHDQTVDLAEANANWMPSEGSLYRPAFEPSHQKLVAKKRNDRYFFEVKELGEHEMDPNRHRLTRLFGNNNSLVADRLNPAEASTKLAEAVSDAKTAPAGKDLTIDAYSRIVLDQMPIEIGYDSIWVSGIIERMKRTQNREDEKPIQILQWHSTVGTPFVAKSEEAERIRAMARMDSHQLIATIKQHKDSFTPAVLAMIDERLTKAVNAALKTNMSISTHTIDSFVDDWNDLVNSISKRYGDVIAARLMSHNEEIISGALSLLDSDAAVAVTQSIYDTGEEEVFPIQYFVENVSFTYVEFFSSELDLDFESKTSALLSKVNTRVWYDLSDQIFKEYGQTCRSHLIRTVDGKVLQVKKGWLTDNAYIINVE